MLSHALRLPLEAPSSRALCSCASLAATKGILVSFFSSAY